jgi:hypothetical protein
LKFSFYSKPAAGKHLPAQPGTATLHEIYSLLPSHIAHSLTLSSAENQPAFFAFADEIGTGSLTPFACFEASKASR